MCEKRLVHHHFLFEAARELRQNGQAPTTRYELVTRDVTGLAAHLAIQTVRFHARQPGCVGCLTFYGYWLLSAPCQSIVRPALLKITYHALCIPYNTAL